MHKEYHKHQEILHQWDSHLRQNFPNSIWSSMTVNFSPQTVTDPHIDAHNCPDGWCPILAGGNFNYRKGGQLVLPDLKLVIKFPPGCVIFLSSVLLVHYNCPIQLGETRYSFTQYTAGGLVRWVENGFQTQDVMLDKLSVAEKKLWNELHRLHWSEGLQFFPVIS
ncbi:hypothetical protein GYMLUDRAFT_281289 [Collybiopsis luxurians FD-317 M1]|nr:hypothetical protein GYMLUDRAFT_281289 [Collybiopsis luxurians FD-317 M1]